MTDKTLYRQCTLKSDNSILVAYLEARVQKGWKITLKESENPEQWWEIIQVSQSTLAKGEIKDAHDSKNWYKKDYLGKLKGLPIKN